MKFVLSRIKKGIAMQPDPRPSDLKILGFDGLRGLAIAVVIAHHIHAAGDFKAAPVFNWLLEAGWMGVDLFFVLSGFLITGILLKARGKPHYWKRFIARRAVRILPLYAFVLLLTVALHVYSTGTIWSKGDTLSPVWLLSFFQNWFIGLGDKPALTRELTWSLAIEEQYYLLWPLFVAKCSRKHLAALCLAVVLASPAVRLLVNAGAGPVPVYYWTITRVDGLALGSLMALAVSLDATRFRLRLSQLAVPLLATLVVVTLLGFNDRRETWFVAFGYSLIALTCASVLMSVHDGYSPKLRAALCWWPLVYLGQVSYGLYLLHGIAIGAVYALTCHLMANPADSSLACAVYTGSAVLGSNILAWMSWRYLEEPALRYKDSALAGLISLSAASYRLWYRHA